MATPVNPHPTAAIAAAVDRPATTIGINRTRNRGGESSMCEVLGKEAHPLRHTDGLLRTPEQIFI
jgi:hypothetical protein